MAITGHVEVVAKTAISGWCVDDTRVDPVDVEVRVGSLRLGSVHADILAKQGARVSGFPSRHSCFGVARPAEVAVK